MTTEHILMTTEHIIDTIWQLLIGHHRNQKSRKWSGAHAHPVPAFFLTIVVVVQNVPLRMTDMATEGNLTPMDSLEAWAHAQPEVAQYPP
jgi:hypothetical protein